jgi:phospholipase C
VVEQWSAANVYGWYSLVVTIVEDPGFEYALAGHLENGQDSMSDPLMGGLLQANQAEERRAVTRSGA